MSTNRSSADSDSSVRAGILANVPSLRAFAISLSGNVDRADDLVQETLLRALAKIDSFEPGTNLPAWLFKILRNAFLTEYRKRRREVADSNGQHAQTLKTYPEQHSHVDFKELQQALGKLPASQREALILVGASGFSYKEAAEICGCAVGTVKSRVNRARVTLAELLSIEDTDDFRPGSSEPRGDRRHRRYERAVDQSITHDSRSRDRGYRPSRQGSRHRNRGAKSVLQRRLPRSFRRDITRMP